MTGTCLLLILLEVWWFKWNGANENGSETPHPDVAVKRLQRTHRSIERPLQTGNYRQYQAFICFLEVLRNHNTVLFMASLSTPSRREKEFRNEDSCFDLLGSFWIKHRLETQHRSQTASTSKPLSQVRLSGAETQLTYQSSRAIHPLD